MFSEGVAEAEGGCFQNRMKESLNLFDKICNGKYFFNTALILFLNKIDLFEIKIKHTNITVALTSYKGERAEKKHSIPNPNEFYPWVMQSSPQTDAICFTILMQLQVPKRETVPWTTSANDSFLWTKTRSVRFMSTWRVPRTRNRFRSAPSCSLTGTFPFPGRHRFCDRRRHPAHYAKSWNSIRWLFSFSSLDASFLSFDFTSFRVLLLTYWQLSHVCISITLLGSLEQSVHWSSYELFQFVNKKAIFEGKNERVWLGKQA